MIRKMFPGEEANFNKVVSHPVQSTYWGKFLESIGRKVEYLVEEEKGEIIKAYLITFPYKLPLIHKRIAYIQKCLLPTKELIEYIKLKYPDVFFIKVEPQVEDNQTNRDYLNSLLFRKSSWDIFLPNSFILDLRKPVEEIINNFSGDVKRNIKKAIKNNVTIEERVDEDAINIFLSLNNETALRHRFLTHSDSYYRKMWNTLRQKNVAKMVLAKKGDMHIACVIIFTFNNIQYYPYGASTRKIPNTGAMAYLLKYVIETGSANGISSFDLWGSLGSNPNPEDPLYGVHTFKSGFGGKEEEYVGAYDYVILKNTYRLFNLLSALRKKYIKLRKRLK